MYETVQFYRQIETPCIAATPAAAVFDAATLAWVAAVIVNGGTVSAGRKTLVDNLITGLKADGVWTKLDRLWLFAGENQPSALTDVVADTLATNVNSTTFTTDRGYTGATATYVETNYNPGDGGTYKYLANDAHFSDFNLTNDVADNRVECGQDNSATSLQWFAGAFYARLMDGGGPTTPGQGNGHNLTTRSVNNLRTTYQNGSSVGTDATPTSVLVENFTFRVLGYTSTNNTDAFPDQIGAFSAGGGLTGTDVSNFYTRLRAYLTAVGVP